jgi:hypothetical protein
MANLLLTGGCFCGEVRYQCGALLYPATLCHCESCRRVSGAHVVAWITVAVETFVFTKTKPLEFNSSKQVFRSFCPQCGTPLTYRREQRAGEIDITLATLDRPSEVSPIDHIYMEDAVLWDRPKDGLPQFVKTRNEPSL